MLLLPEALKTLYRTREDWTIPLPIDEYAMRREMGEFSWKFDKDEVYARKRDLLYNFLKPGDLSYIHDWRRQQSTQHSCKFGRGVG